MVLSNELAIDHRKYNLIESPCNQFGSYLENQWPKLKHLYLYSKQIPVENFIDYFEENMEKFHHLETIDVPTIRKIPDEVISTYSLRSNLLKTKVK